MKNKIHIKHTYTHAMRCDVVWYTHMRAYAMAYMLKMFCSYNRTPSQQHYDDDEDHSDDDDDFDKNLNAHNEMNYNNNSQPAIQSVSQQLVHIRSIVCEIISKHHAYKTNNEKGYTHTHTNTTLNILIAKTRSLYPSNAEITKLLIQFYGFFS